MPVSFFDASRRFYSEHQAFSTVSQSAALGLFNLRREVNATYTEAGYFSSGTKPDHGSLRQKFLAGSGLTKGDFLHLSSLDHFRDDLAILVHMSLMTNISLFEGWQDALSKEYGLSNNQTKALEWPGQLVYPRHTQNGASAGPGCPDMLSSIRAAENSTLMEDTFGPVLTSAPGYSRSNIDDFYVCFRAWKEARNCITHAGGRASNRLITDAVQLANLSSGGLPPLKWFPQLAIPTQNELITIPFKDVMSFGQVLRHIVCTVDAELAQTQRGEQVFFSRFEAHRRSDYYDVPSHTARRQRVIREICKAINFPKVANAPGLDAALTSRFGAWLRPYAEA